MELMAFLIVAMAVFALIGALAAAFGADSRESFDETELDKQVRSFASVSR
jgi:hypothetical protein